MSMHKMKCMQMQKEAIRMRTTVEIPDRLRAALLTIAGKRGLRGYSQVVEEALDDYVRALTERDKDLAEILAMKGIWSDKDARETRQAVREVRRNWERPG